MLRTVLHRFLAVLILTAPLGCDNVEWTGVRVALEPPPEKASTVPETPAEEPEIALPPLPEGPVLYLGERSDGGAILTPVAEVRDDSLAPLPSEAEHPGYREHFVERRMAPGTRFTLFADGTRLGTFFAGDSVTVDPSLCSAPPTVRGIVEVLPAAAEVRTFLALPELHDLDPPRAPYRPVQVDEGVLRAANNVAGAVIMEVGTGWPPSITESRADARLFRIPGDEPPVLAATYLHRQTLEVGEAEPTSYSFLYLAEDRGVGYRWSHIWYTRPGPEAGKAAPRFLVSSDWDRDGRPNVLLEVFGATNRWFAALERDGEEWNRGYEDPCGVQARGAGPAVS